MSRSNNIFLIGPMGVGKTTVGRQLAKKLSKTFYDSDQEIEHRTGADIPLIFEIESEAGFRKREAKLLKELVQKDNIVLSTGGGSILDPESRQNLKANGKIIYLKSSSDKIFKRTVGDRYRPLLQGGDKLQKIESILKEREPFYLEIADEIIDTDDLGIRQIIQTVITGVDHNEDS